MQISFFLCVAFWLCYNIRMFGFLYFLTACFACKLCKQLFKNIILGLATRDLGSGSDADRGFGSKDHFASTQPRSGSELRAVYLIKYIPKSLRTFCSIQYFTSCFGTPLLRSAKISSLQYTLFPINFEKANMF